MRTAISAHTHPSFPLTPLLSTRAPTSPARQPKRIALAESQAQLDAAQTKLAKIMARIKQLDQALATLTAQFETATNAKLKCQQEADETNKTIDLANRLVGGLSSEKTRWGEAVENFKQQEVTLPGDVLLVTAFISYTGCFTKTYRDRLYDGLWIPFLKKMENPIPVTEGLDPLTILATQADIAGWQNDSYLPNAGRRETVPS